MLQWGVFRKAYEVYTDGSCKDGCGSWAYVIVRSGKIHRECSGSMRNCNSNFMEFQAAIEALKSLPANSHITLYSDSRILVDAVTLRMSEWKSYGWLKKNGRSIPHLDQIKALDDLNESHQIDWKWVKAHAGNTYNERCDELCTITRNLK